MKTALYLGYSAAQNFGDWWLYDVIRDDLPALKLLPFSRLVRRAGLRKRLVKAWEKRLLPSPKLVCLGGGTILVPCSNDFLRPLEVTRGAKVTLGSGAKSAEEIERYGLLNPNSQARLLHTLESLDALTVRGPISLESLRVLGVQREIQIVGDPMLSLYQENTPFSPWDGKTVWLNVANVRETQGHFWLRDDQEETALYARIIEQLRAQNCQITLFHCAPEDRAIAQSVAQTHDLPVENVLTPSAMRALLKPGGALVATRLHAMIYAITQGLPVATLAYQDKHLDFLRSVGWDESVRLNAISAGQESEILRGMWDYGARNWPQIAGEIENLNRARHQFYAELQA